MYAKSAETIANIFEAARSLFIVKNFADVTMADIADEAGVTKGALYHHFSSKEDLYLKMMHDYLGEMESLSQEAVDLEGCCRERLLKLTLSFLRLPPERQSLMQLVRRDINIFKGDDRRDLIRAYQKALPEKAEAIVRDGIDDGELLAGDARLLAWEHVAMVEVVLAPYARRVLGKPEEMADFVTRLFFEGTAAQ